MIYQFNLDLDINNYYNDLTIPITLDFNAKNYITTVLSVRYLLPNKLYFQQKYIHYLTHEPLKLNWEEFFQWYELLDVEIYLFKHMLPILDKIIKLKVIQ